jgi:hypothetical protein
LLIENLKLDPIKEEVTPKEQEASAARGRQMD